MPRFCGKCGSPMGETDRVCGQCGSPVSAEIINNNSTVQTVSTEATGGIVTEAKTKKPKKKLFPKLAIIGGSVAVVAVAVVLLLVFNPFGWFKPPYQQLVDDFGNSRFKENNISAIVKMFPEKATDKLFEPLEKLGMDKESLLSNVQTGIKLINSTDVSTVTSKVTKATEFTQSEVSEINDAISTPYGIAIDKGYDLDITYTIKFNDSSKEAQEQEVNLKVIELDLGGGERQWCLWGIGDLTLDSVAEKIKLAERAGSIADLFGGADGLLSLFGFDNLQDKLSGISDLIGNGLSFFN